MSAGILFTDDTVEVKSEHSIVHVLDRQCEEKDIAACSDLYDNLKKTIYNYDKNAYSMLEWPDHIIAMAIIWAARKENKIRPIISPHFLKIYDFNEEEINSALEWLLTWSVKLPFMKRDSSWQSIPEIPNRINNMEFDPQGMLFF